MSNLNVTQGVPYTPFASASLVSLANSAYLLDTVGFDNSAGLMTAIDLQIVFGTAFTPATGGTIWAYLDVALDGTSFPSASASTPPTTLPASFFGCIAVSTTVVQILDIPMTVKAKTKILLWNNSGAAFPTGTITATAYPKTLSMV